MKNNTIVRKENQAGGFTTINYSILRDKNLTSNAKILLIEILSDSDKFTFSETLFVNRMGISKSTYYRALNKLIENGYVRKTKIGESHKNYYTVSEYGNLLGKKEETIVESENQNDSAQTLNVENSSNNSTKKLDADKANEELADKVMTYLIPFTQFFTEDVVNKYQSMMADNRNYYEMKSSLTKLIEKEKKKHFAECKKNIENTSAYKEATKKAAIKLLKVDIFEKNIKVENPMKIVHRAVANINRKKPIDIESLAYDRLSGTPEDD